MSLKSFTKKLLSNVQTNVKAINIAGQTSVATLTLSPESLDESTKAHATGLASQLDQSVEAALIALGAEEYDSLTTAQKTAAMFAARIALDPKKSIFTKPRQIEGDINVSAESLGVSDVVSYDSIQLGAEAFDGQAVNNALYYSIVYNAGAARQDAFGEAFFKTITIDPAVSGISADIEFTAIYTDFQRSKDGVPSGDQFNMVPVVKAIYNNDLFGQDKNRIMPVVTSTSTALFVPGESFQSVSNGETVTTAPMIFGKKIGLLGLSQGPALLAKGEMDSTDALDHTINVDRVYYQLAGTVGGNDLTEDFMAVVSQLPQSNFVPKLQGQFKDLTLGFETSAITVVTGTQKTTNGSASAILGALAGSHTVNLRIVLNGSANTQYGDIEVFGSAVEVASVLNAAGDIVAVGSAEYTAVVAGFAGIKLLGYTVEAYRTNSNLRTRGVMATNWNKKEVYQVPLRSGLTVVTPINQMGGVDNDAARLTSQIQIAGIRTSIHAVQTLTNAAVTFAQTVGANLVADAEFTGIGSNLVKTYYNTFAVDLGTSIDSIKSSDRLDDIRHGLVNRIREEVIQMYILSGYNVAFEQAMGSTVGNVKVVIGTDPHIKQYLTNGAAEIIIGEGFDVEVVSSNNPLVRGKIYITFVKDDNEDVIDPLNFGNCIWSPTITLDFQRSNGGSVVREFNNIPRYLHIINLPILAEIDVSNIAAVLGKVAINTHTV